MAHWCQFEACFLLHDCSGYSIVSYPITDSLRPEELYDPEAEAKSNMSLTDNVIKEDSASEMILEGKEGKPTAYPKDHTRDVDFVMVWCLSIYPYSSGLLHWHWGNHMMRSASEAILNNMGRYITCRTIMYTKQDSTAILCAYFMRYTASVMCDKPVTLACKWASQGDSITF